MFNSGINYSSKNLLLSLFRSSMKEAGIPIANVRLRKNELFSTFTYKMMSCELYQAFVKNLLKQSKFAT